MRNLLVIFLFITLSLSSRNVLFESISYPYPPSNDLESVDYRNHFKSISLLSDGTLYTTGNLTHFIAPQTRDYSRIVYRYFITHEKIRELMDYIKDSGFYDLPSMKHDNRTGIICDSVHSGKNFSKEVCRPVNVYHSIPDGIYQKIISFMPVILKSSNIYTPSMYQIQVANVGKYLINNEDDVVDVTDSEYQELSYSVNFYSEKYWNNVNDHVIFKNGDKYFQLVVYSEDLSVFEGKIEIDSAHSYMILPLLIAGISFIFFMMCICFAGCRMIKRNDFVKYDPEYEYQGAPMTEMNIHQSNSQGYTFAQQPQQQSVPSYFPSLTPVYYTTTQ